MTDATDTITDAPPPARRLPLLSAGVIGAIMLAVLSSWQLRVDEIAVVTTLGSPKVVNQPGLKARMPWPVQKVIRFDRRSQTFTTRARQTVTQDGVPVIIQLFATWKIADPLTFFNSVGSRYEADGHLRTLLDSGQESVIRSHRFADFTGAPDRPSKLPEIEAAIAAAIAEQATSSYGIEIESVGISRVGLLGSNTASILARMAEEQARMAAEIRSEGEKEAQIIRNQAVSAGAAKLAEAEAKARTLRGEAMIAATRQYEAFKEDLEFAVFLRKIEALEELSKTKTTIILDRNTEPFDLLENPNRKKSGE